MQDIPPWEVETILSWLNSVFVYKDTSGLYESEKYQYSIVRSIETENRLLINNDLGIEIGGWSQMQGSLLRLISAGDFGSVIVFIECVVKHIRGKNNVLFYRNVLSSEDVLARLELSLERGSKWRVEFSAKAEAGLVERVDPKLTQIAAELGNDYITRAWNEAFSVTPKPANAIENAQRAIEDIATSKGLSTAKTSVFGNLLGDIRTHPQRYVSAAKDAFALSTQIFEGKNGKTDINIQFSNWFWNGLDLIQKSNPGRHANELTKDFTLSPEVGKQATLVATLLCQLISSDFFSKDQSENAG